MRNEENDVERVGFVGLGAIGSPMAQRLIVSGFEVAVFDIVLSVAVSWWNWVL